MIDGVLFDWRGTLVRDPELDWWVRTALRRLGEEPSEHRVFDVVSRLTDTEHLPELEEARTTADCSAEQHRGATMAWFAAAGLEPRLAECLYGLDFDPELHMYYEDAAVALSRLKAHGTSVAIVSDIHFDLRPEFRLKGLLDYVDHFVLSFEHGIQKPNPAMFELALELLALEPQDALMVGDRPRDAGAALVGIPALVLPNELGPRRGLDRVLRLVNAQRSDSGGAVREVGLDREHGRQPGDEPERLVP
jgi:FMN phosphatase YigB (HAD superfamily)